METKMSDKTSATKDRQVFFCYFLSNSMYFLLYSPPLVQSFTLLINEHRLCIDVSMFLSKLF